VAGLEDKYGTAEIARLLVETLRKMNYKVTTAESCTGGLLASYIVGIDGASDVFDEGTITYSNMAKARYLGVPCDLFKAHGAVSSQVAKAMAEGAAAAARADTAISTTGIAGPTGGTDDKPVGTVYIGCFVNGETMAEHHIFKGDRTDVREQAAYRALFLLHDILSNK